MQFGLRWPNESSPLGLRKIFTQPFTHERSPRKLLSFSTLHVLFLVRFPFTFGWIYRNEKVCLSLTLTIVDAPLTFLIQIIFSVIVYFLVCPQKTAQQFFAFYPLVLRLTLTMKVFYSALAAAFNRERSAQATAGLATLLLVLYTGYAMPKPSMVAGLRWLTWISVSDTSILKVNMLPDRRSLLHAASSLWFGSDSFERVPHD